MAPLRVLLPVSIGTGLSLVGDASLYAVLPTHVNDAGIALASVGIILSVNRLVRLLLNGPAGIAYDRWRRRPLFVTSLCLGACSTAIYALFSGFWPLLIGRLLWGLSWSGIWVGGNTMIVDVSSPQTRGRWVGLYNISFFLGTSSGSVLGGVLTDWLGYSPAMGIGAGLTFSGAMIALLFLPETFQHREESPSKGADTGFSPGADSKGQVISAMALMGVNRLVGAGVLSSTLGLFLLENLGARVTVGGHSVGVASLTGMGLGISYLVSMSSAPVMGRISDQGENRWKTVSAGLLPGVAGLAALALGTPLAIVLGLSLTAFATGSNQGLSISITGDLSSPRRRGRRMGILFTIGDLTSAVGPVLSYALIPYLGLKALYLACSVLFLLMLMVTWRWGRRLKPPSRDLGR